MDAALQSLAMALAVVVLRASRIMQNQSVCGERDRLANIFGCVSVGQRRGDGFGSLFATTSKNGSRQLSKPLVISLLRARLPADQFVLVKHLRQRRSNRKVSVSFRADPVIFLLHAVANRLSQQRVSILFARESQHIPGPPGECNAMHIDVVVHDVLQSVEGVRGIALRQPVKSLLGSVHLAGPHHGLQSFAAALVGQRIATDRLEHFRFATAVLLYSFGVAVQNLEHGQRFSAFRHQLRHLPGRHQRHDRVKANVVLSAKTPCVGQRSRGHQRLEFNTRTDLLDQHRLQLARRRVLHQPDQRLQRTKRHPIIRLVRPIQRLQETLDDRVWTCRISGLSVVTVIFIHWAVRDQARWAGYTPPADRFILTPRRYSVPLDQ